MKSTNIKNVKFSNRQILDFFDFINDVVSLGVLDNRIRPLKGLSSCKNPEIVKQRVTTPNFNAYACFKAGYVYDAYHENRVRSNEERLEETVPKIEKTLVDIQNALDKHKEFNNIKVENVTKKYDIVTTYVDRYDDGNDKFGIEVFLKFSFK